MPQIGSSPAFLYENTSNAFVVDSHLPLMILFPPVCSVETPKVLCFSPINVITRLLPVSFSNLSSFPVFVSVKLVCATLKYRHPISNFLKHLTAANQVFVFT